MSEAEVTDKKTNKERIKEIVAGIEDGIQKLFQSEKYFDYLRTMTRFHSYSVNNTVLIHLQMPNASHVAGFNQWKNRFSRHVKKGAKGITIIAPTPFKKKVEEMKLDPDTNEPMYDENGKLIMEEKTIQIPMFKPVKVFDLSQTEGKPLPNLCADLAGDVRQYEAFMEALRRSSPVPIAFQPIEKSMDGYFSRDEQKIVVRTGMSQVQTVCATIHEIGHAMLHNREQAALTAAAGTDKEAPKPKDRNTEEVEAESLSYSVCAYYGIETGSNSFGYIASWSKDKTLPELRASLETITKTANTLITTIDKHFSEICKERGITLSEREEPSTPEQTPEASVVPEQQTSEAPTPAQSAEETPAPSPEDKGNDTPPSQEAPTEEPSAPLADTPEHFSRDYCDYLEQLYNDGKIDNPFSAMSKDELIQGVVTVLREGMFDGTRETLSEAIKHTHDPEASTLMVRMEKLRAQWEESLTFTVEDYPLSKDERDKSSVTMSPPNDPDHKKSKILFIGPTVTCQKLAQELRDGTMTVAQVEALRDQWYEAQARADEIANLPDQQVLYLLDDTQYLHIQTSDAGFDYSLYNAKTLRLLDGGQFSAESTLKHPAQNAMEASFREVCVLQGLEPARKAETPLDMLETIEEANAIPELLPDAEESRNLPDPAITPRMMERYGYTEGDMLPLSKDRALELAEKDLTLFMLYQDGRAEMVFDAEDIENHDGIFGIPSDEWEEVKGEIPPRDVEKRFLDNPKDALLIYQFNDAMPRNRHFESYDRLDGPPLREHYNAVYTADLTDARKINEKLEETFATFNMNRPGDFTGHSLSVGDIVAIKSGGAVSYHYCDSFGFRELPNFNKSQPENYLKNAELAMEDDANMIDGIINNGPKQPTVAELEAQVKAGQTISLMDLANATHAEERKKAPAKQEKTPGKRPSVLARLNEPLRQQTKKQKTAPAKSAERNR